MGWLSFILLAIELLMKLPAIIETIQKMIDLIRGRPFWKQSAMRAEAAKAMKAAVDRANFSVNVKGGAVVSTAGAQLGCAPELLTLCEQWKQKYE